MKQNKRELDVDFIGGMGPLTKKEGEAISEFIKASKKKQKARKARITTKKKVKII